MNSLVVRRWLMNPFGRDLGDGPHEHQDRNPAPFLLSKKSFSLPPPKSSKILGSKEDSCISLFPEFQIL